MRTLAAALAAVTAVIGLAAPVSAQDKLKLAIGAPGNWDSCVPDVGLRAGIFKKHGIELETLYTQGGGETMQVVISGSLDIGIAAGTAAILGAYAKGAPVRIIGGGTTGTSDLYWYVPTASPLQSFKDTNGKTVAYSTNGASTHTTVLALIKHFGTTAKATATGASAVTFTQAMSGQVDVGWASPPFGLEELSQGKIRMIARGSDAPSTRDQTARAHLVNARVLGLMKPGSYLVNTARGGLVNVDDALAALDSGRLGGLALDVLPTEPPGDHPLVRHPRTILTPHAAFFSREAEIELRRKAAQNIITFAQTGRPDYVVIEGAR